jgi:radical SAM superfamily enzyme
VQQANAELQERILVLDKQLQEQRSEVAATKAHLAAREHAMHAQLGSCQSQLTTALAEVQVLRERYQERALERDRLQQVNVGTVSGMT